MFPDAEHPPAITAKRFGDKPIPERVGRELLLPKGPIVDGHIGVLGASMPETAINKNHDALPAKGEIRFSKKHLSATPAGDAMRPHKFGKDQFGVLVAMSANARHDVRAFFLGEYIGHSLTFTLETKPSRLLVNLYALCGLLGGWGFLTRCEFAQTECQTPLPGGEIVRFLGPVGNLEPRFR